MTGRARSSLYKAKFGKPVAKKSERPVGVPAALAWGMEGLPSRIQFLPDRAGLFNCARQQENNAQEQDRHDHSAHSRLNRTPDYMREFAGSVGARHWAERFI